MRPPDHAMPVRDYYYRKVRAIKSCVHTVSRFEVETTVQFGVRWTPLKGFNPGHLKLEVYYMCKKLMIQ